MTDLAIARDPIDLMAYFEGHRECWGYVRGFLGKTRRFTASFDGICDGGTLVIAERMKYEDGDMHMRDWRMNNAPQGWAATAADVCDQADIVRDGVQAVWRYRMDYPAKTGTLRLSVVDRMTLVAPGRIASELRIRKTGLPVARGFIVYAPDCRRHAASGANQT